MDESKASPRKVKVVDKRKFTTDGEPITQAVDGSEEDRGPKPTEDQPANVNEPDLSPTLGRRASSEPVATSPEFLELVAMLAHQAEVLLIGAEDLPAQPAEAQRVINYLGALEKKTAGNLSSDEEKILQNLMYQLRTLFLQNSNK